MHEECPRIVYNDNRSSFEEFLETDDSVSVHYINTQTLATMLHKIVNGLSPYVMKDVFPSNINLLHEK